MNAIDLSILILFTLFFILGYRKGLLRTLAGPIALIIGSFLAYYYYQQTGKMIVALILGIAAPFLLNLVISFLLKIWQKSNKDSGFSLSLNGLFGGVLNLTWCGALMILAIICVMLLPKSLSQISSLQENIRNSHTYTYLENITKKVDQSDQYSINKLATILNNPEKVKGVSKTEEYQELMEDENIRSMLQDEDLVTAIENKDYLRIMRHPKTQKIIQNKETVAKILALQKEILKDTP